jgi:CubicO group peptidase (beta-lactamase class C family)
MTLSGRTVGAMDELADAVARVASETGFSGVVRVDRGEQIELVLSYGFADRAYGIANAPDTQFAVASAVSPLEALAVMALVEDGVLALSTTARSLLGADLPLIDDDVTVEHLLAHRSGMGDYLDEDTELDLGDYLMPVPVHELATTEQFLRVLGGHPPKFAPGTSFSYCNGGYVVLALLAERASGIGFHELVHERVGAPAGLAGTAYLRSDELPARAARGYLTADGSLRTNVFHLPVRGNGDGGAYMTVADVAALWRALFAGRIVPSERVADMIRPRSTEASGKQRYGLGFWLAGSGNAVILEGSDAGCSFRSVHDPGSELTHTVISNVTDGAWPIARLLTTR